MNKKIVAAILIADALALLACYEVQQWHDHRAATQASNQPQFGHLSFAAAPGANQQVFITATDATGKTRTVTATRVDPFVWDAGNVTIHYTTDQYLCSGFEP